jgi:bacteriocin-like protein
MSHIHPSLIISPKDTPKETSIRELTNEEMALVSGGAPLGPIPFPEVLMQIVRGARNRALGQLRSAGL